MNMQIQGAHAHVNNLNTRCEKHGEDSVPAADLKVTMTCTVDDVTRLAGETGKTGPLSSMYDKAGSLKYFSIAHVAFDMTFEHQRITIDEREIEDATVKGLKAIPKDGRTVDLVATIQFAPSAELLGDIFENLLDQDVEISIVAMNPDLGLEGGGRNADDDDDEEDDEE